MTSRRHLAALFAPVAALLLAACASQSPAVAPAAPPQADASPSRADAPMGALALNDLEAQLAVLGASEDQITRAIHKPPPAGNRVGTDGDKDQKKAEEQERTREPSAVATAAPTSPPSTRSGAAVGQGSFRAGDDGLGGADACVTACSALSSMGRAAKHLCDLTGDGDTRCDSARSRVSGATERVMSSCPACTPDN
jgi:hypothetical protein